MTTDGEEPTGTPTLLAIGCLLPLGLAAATVALFLVFAVLAFFVGILEALVPFSLDWVADVMAFILVAVLVVAGLGAVLAFFSVPFTRFLERDARRARSERRRSEWRDFRETQRRNAEQRATRRQEVERQRHEDALEREHSDALELERQRVRQQELAAKERARRAEDAAAEHERAQQRAARDRAAAAERARLADLEQEETSRSLEHHAKCLAGARQGAGWVWEEFAEYLDSPDGRWHLAHHAELVASTDPRGREHGEWSIDLHGRYPQTAAVTLALVLHDAWQAGLERLVIIHGGDGFNPVGRAAIEAAETSPYVVVVDRWRSPGSRVAELDLNRAPGRVTPSALAEAEFPTPHFGVFPGLPH